MATMNGARGMMSDLVPIGESILAKWSWYRKLGLDTDATRRLLVIECRLNLEILGPLNLGPGCEQDTPALRRATAELCHGALEALLAAEDRSAKTFDELKNIKSADSEEDGAGRDNAPASAADMVRRVYVRMCAVAALVRILEASGDSGIDPGIRKINIALRLRNIQATLVEIDKALSCAQGKR